MLPEPSCPSRRSPWLPTKPIFSVIHYFYGPISELPELAVVIGTNRLANGHKGELLVAKNTSGNAEVLILF